MNTENDSFDHRRCDSLIKSFFKIVVRRWLKLQIHDIHIANAQSQAKYLLNHYKLPKTRLRTIVNGIDCDHFKPADIKSLPQTSNLSPDRLWILCVGQARSEKRVEWAIRAAQRLRFEFPNMPFCFAYLGDGPELQRWQIMVKDAGIGEDFVFLGAHNDTAPFFQSASLMAHAAERESFGLSIVEAMASALPVVAVSAAGPSETVVDGVTGKLVGLNDEEGYYQAIVAYLLDSELRKEHGTRARERAVALYSIRRQAREYADVLHFFADPS